MPLFSQYFKRNTFLIIPRYTGAATSNHKLARSPLKAQRRPKGCLGFSRVAQRTLRPRHGRHGHHEVLSMFKTVAQRSPRRLVAHRSLKGDRRTAHVSLWSQNGCIGVSHRSPDAAAFLVPPLCLVWPTKSVHWAITLATTLPRPRQPLSYHGNGSAPILPSLHDLLCNYISFGGSRTYKGRAVAVTQKQNFLGLGDHWASWSFFRSLNGGT